MTLFVTEPWTSNPNRWRKPVALYAAYQRGGSLNGNSLQYLIDQNPEAIYFSDNPDEDFGPFTPEVVDPRTLLASRLWAHSQQVDFSRASRENAFTADDFASISRHIDRSLACLEEIERIWEALYGAKPNAHDMHKWKAN